MYRLSVQCFVLVSSLSCQRLSTWLSKLAMVGLQSFKLFGRPHLGLYPPIRIYCTPR